MVTTTFKIRKGKKKSPIYLFIQNGREFRIRQSTNISILNENLKFWNNKEGRIKNLSNISNYEMINEKLSSIRKDIEAGIKILNDKDRLDKLNCKKLIENTLNPCEGKICHNTIFENPEMKSVITYFEWFLDYYSIHPSPNTHNILKKGTLKTYKNTKSFLLRYLNARQININDFTFNHITKDFYYDLLDFANSENKSTNYIGTIIQKLITIIRSAQENDIHQNNEHQKKYFAKISEEAENIYLTEEELMKISTIKLESEFLKNVRDTFLISCYTAMRISDLENFLKNPTKRLKNNKERQFLCYTQQKTGKDFEIPLKSELIQILNKRNNVLPKYIPKSKLNKFIKIIGEKAGITEIIEKTMTRGGISETNNFPKYKLITMHTGRRSFCTNAYLKGVPLQFIMIASGHQSEKMLHKYIKASSTEKAKKLSEFDFFN